MFLRSVVGKLWITILILFSIVLAVLLFLLIQFYSDYYTDNIKKKLVEYNQTLTKVFDTYGFNQELVNIYFDSNTEKFETIVVLENGTTFSSVENIDYEKAFQYVKQDPELLAVLQEGSSVTKNFDLPKEFGMDVNSEGIIIASPFEFGGRKGAIYSFEDLKIIKESTYANIRFIIIAEIIGFLAITVFAFFLVSRVTKPIRNLNKMAHEIAQGNFEQKIPVATSDEIGQLTSTFNQMSQQMNEHITALSLNKEHLSNILSSMIQGVITLNRQGEILVSNKIGDVFIQLSAFENDQNESFDEQHLPPVLSTLLKKVVDAESLQTSEIKLQDKDWLITMSPLYADHQVYGAVAIIRETTEEKRLDRTRTDFIANVSHELRTPLVMLQGYSEAIVDDVAETQEEKKEMAQIILDEAQRIGRLVNELLDLARIEAGHIVLEKKLVHLVPYLKRIANKFQGLANEGDATIQVKIEPGDPSINLDPDRIEQVLTNLIGNALRYLPSGGRIEISQESQRHGMRFSVKDNGSGISKEDLQFVFERFYKVDKARTRGKSGTGLGLTIAKNIVQAHNGIISVDSEVGKGTTFTFFLPY